MDEIGELTPRQVWQLYPSLQRILSGESEPEPEISYLDACRAAGVLNRLPPEKRIPPPIK